MTSDTFMMTAACSYAARGWHVFPITRDTKGRGPDGRSTHLLPHGHKEASAEIARVAAWWERWPDANIGLSLAASGLVAVDADLYKPDCGWDAFIATRRLPDTFTQESPRGGRHFVFAAARGESFAGKLCPGVDLKHQGYILLAPSTFEGRAYRILSDSPTAPCPDWLPRKGDALHATPIIDIGRVSGPEHAASPDEVAELLSWIDPDADDYAHWVEVLHGLHAHFGGSDVGLQLAIDWSRLGAKFRPGEIEAKWRSFDGTRGITLKTIAQRARQNGADLSAIGKRHKTGGLAPRPVTPTSPDARPATCDTDLSHDCLAIELGEAGFNHDARHVAAQNRWYFWNGTYWQADQSLDHLTRVRRYLRERAKAYLATTDGQKSGAVSRQVEQLKSQKTVSSVAALARTNPASVALADAFDRDLYLLGTPGGTVDLRDGAMRQAQRADLITRQTSCGPAPHDVPPTRWLSFLNEIMDGDRNTIAFLQRAAGYALTGATNEHKLLFLHGSGRNGKSVFLNTLLDIWGGYGRRVAAGTFLSGHTERHPTDLASLRGARLAVASELPRGKCWDEAVIKDLTGGDRMTARFMRQDFFEFEPQLTLMIAGNVQPSFRGVDAAIRSRVVLVPFTVTIPSDRQDRHLPDALKAEAPAILRWCIEGAIAWQRGGLAVPQRLREASEAYFDEEDIVGQFLREQTEYDPGGFVPGTELIERFNFWLDQQNLTRWTQTTLMKDLRSRGLKDHRTPASRGLKGLRLT